MVYTVKFQLSTQLCSSAQLLVFLDKQNQSCPMQEVPPPPGEFTVRHMLHYMLSNQQRNTEVND